MTASTRYGLAIVVLSATACVGKAGLGAPADTDALGVGAGDTDLASADTDAGGLGTTDTDDTTQDASDSDSDSDTTPSTQDSGSYGDCEGAWNTGETGPTDEPAGPQDSAPVDTGDPFSPLNILFGDLVITEIMVVPSPDDCPSPSYGQYIEIKNATNHTIPLSSLVLRYGVHSFTLPLAHSIAPGGYVVGRPDLPTCAGYGTSLLADFVYPSNMVFSANGASTTVTLETVTRITIDSINYGSWALGLPPDRFASGHAAHLVVGQEDATRNDAPSSWCSADEALISTPIGPVGTAPSFGSPGRAAQACAPPPVPPDTGDTADSAHLVP